MKKDSKPVRHETIYQLLQDTEEYALSLTEIHERLQEKGIYSSRKTIERDLLEMGDSFGICETEHYPVRFFKSPGHKRDYQLSFSESELQTLILALHGFKTTASSALKSLCTQTETIFLSKLHENDQRNFNELKKMTIFTPSFRGESATEDPVTFRKVMKALRERTVIECENHSPYVDPSQYQKKKKYAPLYLNLVGGENYLWVYDFEDDKAKQLKICRLHSVTLLNKNFDEQLKDKLGELEGRIGGFGGPDQKIVTFRIHCDRTMAMLFKERKIHHSQVVEGKDNHWVIEFTANESFEIFRYIAGWAKYIYKLEPESLQREVEEIWDAGIKLKSSKKAA
jgi:predicted DNA-binding transcriptional regulator YafY